MTAAPALPAPSTGHKTAHREDFPVLWLLPPGRRRTVAALYAFARAADDLADAPDLSPAARLDGLDRLERGLLLGEAVADAPPESLRLRAALAAAAIPLNAVTPLLRAFRRDAAGPWTCADWAMLMAYCRESAAPVGRVLLALAGERRPEAVAAADALCAALQVLNHVADCGADWRRLGRCYLPADWRQAEGCPEADLAAARATPALRRVIGRTLDATAVLLAEAAPLPHQLADRSLRAQAAATLAVAGHHHRRLAAGDPLAAVIGPGRLGWMAGGLAALRALSPPDGRGGRW